MNDLLKLLLNKINVIEHLSKKRESKILFVRHKSISRLPKSILEHEIGSSSQSALPTISLLDFFTLLIPPLHLV